MELEQGVLKMEVYLQSMANVNLQECVLSLLCTYQTCGGLWLAKGSAVSRIGVGSLNGCVQRLASEPWK